MKLLITTQKVDAKDQNLGFFHRWLLAFAQQTEQLTVICLEKGSFDLPSNVRVFSLGKEEGKSRLQYLWRFYTYILRERKNYDAVWVHMNVEYVILGGLIWKFLKKKIALWYTHKKISLKLRMAEKIVDRIYSASVESFHLPSHKLLVTGHGIDFDFLDHIQNLSQHNFVENNEIKLITVGRISPVKGYELMFDVLQKMQEHGDKVTLTIVGGPIYPQDELYLHDLEYTVAKKKLDQVVIWKGPLPYEDVIKELAGSHIFINNSLTGSLDKAGLDALAAGVMLVTSNEGYHGIVDGYHADCIFKNNDADDLLLKIYKYIGKTPEEKKKIVNDLRGIVKYHHGLSQLIKKMVADLASFSKIL